MKKINLLYLAMAFTLLLGACKKSDTEPAADPNTQGTLEVEFENFVGSQSLSFDTTGTTYTNTATGEQFSVTMLNYYISNISLKTADGRTYVVPQDSSYFLVKHENPETMKFKINVPEGDYTEMTFMIGVDSARNANSSLPRTGVLDPATGAAGMYWQWKSGYIFFKMEGKSPQSADAAKKFRYHIGLYGGGEGETSEVLKLNCIRTKTLSFGTEKAIVRKSKMPTVHILTDVFKVFNGSTSLKIAEKNTVMVNSFAPNIANNYVDMFTFDHLHND
ncbi:MAG: MbnP family protein [Thermonemataceae bacterium]|nr:MbnP family protein [Thermonemataceae bacterium]